MSAPRYAAQTAVPVERSMSELRQLVQRHGAEGFGVAEESRPPRAMVVFRIAGAQVRLVIEFPGPDAPENRITAGGARARTDAQAEAAAAQERRRRWRALVLVTRAKLEAVASGISTLEREFLADLVLPSGAVVHEELAPRLARWRETGAQLPLIPERAST